MNTQAMLHSWSLPQWEANLLILAHIAGAGVLGLILGYERAYHGRAAGMRTYALVCMASAAVIVLTGLPHYWFGGGGDPLLGARMDPTRVVQGVVTGLGFLCAGVIMRDGLNISGLTTAASLWAASAIGIVLGLGFYFAAITLTLLCAALMMWGSKLELFLPSHPAVFVQLRGLPGHHFSQDALSAFVQAQGYTFAPGSLSVDMQGDTQEWRFVCISDVNYRHETLSRLMDKLAKMPGLAGWRVSHARN